MKWTHFKKKKKKKEMDSFQLKFKSIGTGDSKHYFNQKN